MSINHTNEKTSKRNYTRKKARLFNFSRKRRKKNRFLSKTSLYLKVLFNGLIYGIWDTKSSLKNEYQKDAKLFNGTCNMMSASLVILSVLFVYVENELIYALPIVSVLCLFIRFGKGNAGKTNNSLRDETLYVWLLRANIVVVILVFMIYPNKLWAFNLFSLSIFLVPLSIAKYFGTKNKLKEIEE